jgi:hypothetical protein
MGGRLWRPPLRGYDAAILERLLAILRCFEPTPHYGRVIQHGVIRVAVLAMALDRQQDAGFGIMTPLFDLSEVVHAVQEVCPRDL